jgi:chemotaxis protein MotB
MKTSHIALLLAAVAPACVTSGKYNALQKQLDETKAAMAHQLGEKDGVIKSKDAELAGCQGKNEQDAAEIKRCTADRAKLESDLAATLKDKAALKASADEMRTALDETNRRKAEAEKRLAEFRKLIAQFKSMIDSGKLKVKIVDGRMVLSLASDVLFASGSAELSTGGMQTINQVASILVTIPDRKFQVEGYTDNVPIKTARFPSNWELGAGRAITIVNTIMAAGMTPSRLSAASYGEFKPVAGNDSEQGRTANRRIEIVVVPDLSMLPGFDELKKAVETP